MFVLELKIFLEGIASSEQENQISTKNLLPKINLSNENQPKESSTYRIEHYSSKKEKSLVDSILSLSITRCKSKPKTIVDKYLDIIF